MSFLKREFSYFWKNKQTNKTKQASKQANKQSKKEIQIKEGGERKGAKGKRSSSAWAAEGFTVVKKRDEE